MALHLHLQETEIELSHGRHTLNIHFNKRFERQR